MGCMAKLKLGLIVNPLAGVGGSVGLKGSDGADIVAEAARRGAAPKAMERAARALAFLRDLPVELLVRAGAMGEASAAAAGLSYRVVGQTGRDSSTRATSAQDTCEAVSDLLDEGVDLLVF